MPDSDDDPKNWSPLRQRFEALRAINKIITGPRETISEAMVREALAEQYGIKPEEVTWKQIQFEVSGLLPIYPAITVIPTNPPSEDDTPSESAPAAPEYENERRAFVIPLLEQKGWSALEWAVEAGVDKATANDYLDNKTKPYRSTRLKLAKALGVPVEQLPK